MGDLSSNFSRSEFACKCGCGFGLEVGDVNMDLLRVLEILRLTINRPLIVTPNGGCRCRKHNAAVGGAASSQHMLGTAADVACPKGVQYPVFKKYAQDALERVCKKGGGFGTYPINGFIHMDVRRHGATWSGRSSKSISKKSSEG